MWVPHLQLLASRHDQLSIFIHLLGCGARLHTTRTRCEEAQAAYICENYRGTVRHISVIQVLAGVVMGALVSGVPRLSPSGCVPTVQGALLASNRTVVHQSVSKIDRTKDLKRQELLLKKSTKQHSVKIHQAVTLLSQLRTVTQHLTLGITRNCMAGYQ